MRDSLLGGFRGLPKDAPGGEIETVQASPGADPDVSEAALNQRKDVVIAQETGFRLGAMDDEAVAVLAAQTLLRSKPEKTQLVLEDALDRGLWEPIFHT